MARTHDDIMAGLLEKRRERIKACAARMHTEVEGPKALRLLADRSQEQIAQAYGVKQPSVLKTERQTGFHLPLCVGLWRPQAVRWNCAWNFRAMARSANQSEDYITYARLSCIAIMVTD